jgi:lipopolysaccharide export system protein LptC
MRLIGPLALLPPRNRSKQQKMSVVTVEETSNWEPRRALTLRQARKRSRLIAGLRRFFVAAAGASFASVFAFMALFAVEGGFNQRLYANTEPLRMVNPRFTGRTEGGGPYQITAEVATREPGGSQLLELVSPVYRTEAGTVLVAPKGTYDEAAQTIRLDGEVLFRDPGGNRFSTPNLIVDLGQGRIYGVRGVTGAGPLGVMQAGSYELRDSDRALVLRGRVKGQIPARQRTE